MKEGVQKPMADALVIVESPAKAKTISKYLGNKYIVKASMGHVRDLPKSKLGVDVESGYYEPQYITVRGKGDILKGLRAASKKVKKIYLAADPDREGEAIAWHLAHMLNLDADSKCRVIFNEITKQAIKDAFKSPREIDLDLVNAQQARRILDRLVGYGISPLLWKKVKRGLSAGRVQSVALKLIIDREDEINNFVPDEYWTLHAILLNDEKKAFEAHFHKLGSKKLELKSKEDVDKLLAEIKDESFIVDKIKQSQRERRPLPPFITSTLQQAAGQKLNFRAQKTMRIAQQLYEGVEIGKSGSTGLITYMRTDSLRIAPSAQEECREYVTKTFGPDYMPAQPRFYKSKKSAQDAHEAIRPTSVFHDPASVKPFLSRDQLRLYTLIWQRFVASQMASALYDVVAADIKAGKALFRANGSVLKFAGFTKVYNLDENDDKETGKKLPKLSENDILTKKELNPKQHFTQPPPRYNEARLVKELEELGIGRPSTYAPTLDTIQRRGYVLLEEKQFVPSELGQIVLRLVAQFFPDIINTQFTATLEQNLDFIEEGSIEWHKLLDDFYTPFSERLVVAEENIEKIVIPDEVSDEVCEKCNSQMVFKHGRYGKFLACSAFPECRNTKAILKLTGVGCPKCKNGELAERKSKKNRLFYGCNMYPECDFSMWDKPSKQPCPKCGKLLVIKKAKKQTKTACTECDYEVVKNNK